VEDKQIKELEGEQRATSLKVPLFTVYENDAADGSDETTSNQDHSVASLQQIQQHQRDNWIIFCYDLLEFAPMGKPKHCYYAAIRLKPGNECYLIRKNHTNQYYFVPLNKMASISEVKEN
jgi:hypothetical protein